MSMQTENIQLEAGVEQLTGDCIDVARRDKALRLLAGRHVDFDPNSPEAKRVRWKIDMRIMPMIFVIYCLQLMDKNSLSYAAIMGIKKDAHLTPANYSWLGSIV